eukprot:gene36429-49073_t
MSNVPATLTPQRIEAMLSSLAEVCYAGVIEAGDRLKAAEDAEAFERTTRALQTLSRNLRQTFAMKQRFDREQARIAAGAREQAETDRKAAETDRQAAVVRHRRLARRRFGELLWTEYEQDDAEALDEAAREWLSELADDDADAFLATPLETLITRLSEAFAVGEFQAEAEPEPEPEPAPEPPPKPPAQTWRTTPPPPEPPPTPVSARSAALHPALGKAQTRPDLPRRLRLVEPASSPPAEPRGRGLGERRLGDSDLTTGPRKLHPPHIPGSPPADGARARPQQMSLASHDADAICV